MIYQTILKTVATTLDLLVAIILILNGKQNRKMVLAYSLFMFFNLTGIWC